MPLAAIAELLDNAIDEVNCAVMVLLSTLSFLRISLELIIIDHTHSRMVVTEIARVCVHRFRMELPTCVWIKLKIHGMAVLLFLFKVIPYHSLFEVLCFG